MTAATKYHEGTFDVEVPGPLTTNLPDDTVKALDDALRSDAKEQKAGDLGELEVVSRTGQIGGVFTVTVRAPIEKAPAK